MTRRSCVAAALGTFILAAAASAGPGDLDPTFSGNGWVRTSEVRGGSVPNAPERGVMGIALQRDGKIVTAGPLADDAFGAFRWLPNGDLDLGFGTGGLAVVRSQQDDEAYATALQRDGKILLAGQGSCAVLSCAMVARLLPDGRVDTSFGRGGAAIAGRLSCPVTARDVAVQADGRIVIAGWRPRANRHQNDAIFALARFTREGRLDITFSRDGCVSIDFSSVDDRAHALAVLRDGRIIAAGMASRPRSRTVEDFAFVRLRRNGTLDRTFSGDGVQTVDFGRSDRAQGITVQRNGRLLVVGITGPYGGDTGRLTAAVVRLRRNGMIDRSFGFRGRLLLRPSRVESFATDAALLPGGGILVVGGAVESARIDSSWDWFLVRLQSNGRPDRSWGRGGLVLGDFGTGEDWASTVVLQPDGKIVVGGQVYVDQAVARFVPR